MRRTVVIAVLAAASAVTLRADDHVVDVDRTVDFRAIKTFSVKARSADAAQPELSNPIVLSNVSGVVRTRLASNRLQERDDRPDVRVEVEVSGQDYWVGPYGRAFPIDGRGANDEEPSGPSLSRKLSDDARALLGEYPPHKK